MVLNVAQVALLHKLFGINCAPLDCSLPFLATPHGAMLMSADIRELLKEKEKRGSYCATCLSTRNIKAAVSTVERKREIKGDIARKKIYVV